MCVAHSLFSRHPSQTGLLSDPVLKGCPFRWQCPINGPENYCSWFLFSFNSSLVLLIKGHCRNPFTWLSGIKDFQYFWWSLFVMSLTAFLAIPAEMPQAGLGLMREHSDPNLASWLAFTLPLVPLWPGSHISLTLLCLLQGSDDGV
jgi:hypothetical protein